MSSRECPAGVAGKGGEELEFPGAQVHGLPVVSKTTSDEIEVEAIGHGQFRPTGEWRAATGMSVRIGSRFDVDHRAIIGRDR